MAITWPDIIALGIDEDTDAQIATKVPKVTATWMRTLAVRQWLRDEDLWYRDSPGAMAGDIQDAINGGGLAPSLLSFLRKLYDRLYSGDENTLRTDTVPYGIQTSNNLDAMVAQGSMLTAAQRTAWLAIGGGQPWAATTELEVTAARAAHVLSTAFDAAWNTQLTSVINPAVASGNTATLITALQTAATNLGG